MAIKFLIVTLGLYLMYAGITDKSPLSAFGLGPNTSGQGGAAVPGAGGQGGGGGGFGARSATSPGDVGVTPNTNTQVVV